MTATRGTRVKRSRIPQNTCEACLSGKNGYVLQWLRNSVDWQKSRKRLGPEVRLGKRIDAASRAWGEDHRETCHGKTSQPGRGSKTDSKPLGYFRAFVMRRSLLVASRLGRGKAISCLWMKSLWLPEVALFLWCCHTSRALHPVVLFELRTIHVLPPSRWWRDSYTINRKTFFLDGSFSFTSHFRQLSVLQLRLVANCKQGPCRESSPRPAL